MRPLGLYVHWPFCAKICPYCDFTVAKNRAVDGQVWSRAFREDLETFAGRVGARPLTSIYFGGGTPSLMPPSVMQSVLTGAADLFGLDPGCEISCEANPDDLERFSGLCAAGIERLSIGIQSFDDRDLAFLGRNHDSRSSAAALDEALRIFPEVSMDLIYALPGETAADWASKLSAALSRGAQHYSLYQLTIEQGTAFGRAYDRGTLKPPDDNHAADLFEVTQALTEAAGFPAYEISNHSMPGREAVHNSLYWKGADWIAIGPGAHGRFGDRENRSWTEGARQPSRYPLLSHQERITWGRLSSREAAVERLAGGLRLRTGFNLEELGPYGGALLKAAQPLAEEGYLIAEGRNLRVHDRGRLVLDYLTSRLADVMAEG